MEPPSSDLKKAFVFLHTHTHTLSSYHTLASGLIVVVVQEIFPAERLVKVGTGSDFYLSLSAFEFIKKKQKNNVHSIQPILLKKCVSVS